MTPHILGIVTEERGAFLCAKCHAPIEMVAIIDRRNLRSKIWREIEPHSCQPIGQPTGTYTYPGMPKR